MTLFFLLNPKSRKVLSGKDTGGFPVVYSNLPEVSGKKGKKSKKKVKPPDISFIREQATTQTYSLELQKALSDYQLQLLAIESLIEQVKLLIFEDIERQLLLAQQAELERQHMQLALEILEQYQKEQEEQEEYAIIKLLLLH